MNKNVAIILGRGIEGCGATKYALELAKYAGKNNARLYAVNDKAWPRANSFKVDCRAFSGADINQVNAVVTDINEWADAVVLMTVPSIDHGESVVANFLDMLSRISAPIVLLQVDHKKASFARNAALASMCDASDQLLAHSTKGEFFKWVKENNIKTPLGTLAVGFEFDDHRAQYWKPIGEQVGTHLKWIGRAALWKGPLEIIYLHNDVLRHNGFITTMEGIEGSLASMNVLYENPVYQIGRRDIIELFRGSNKKRSKSVHGTEEVGMAPYAYPEYVNSECMERLSRVAFGSDLYNLKATSYGSSIEYCHGEIVACGTVPVFHEHFGANVIHRKTGDPLTATDSGTLWYSHEHRKQLADDIIALSKDPGRRDDMRERAFSFWKEHADATKVFSDVLESVFKTKKRPRRELTNTRAATLEDFL